MDMKKLLEAVNKFAGEPNQKAGDQVKASDEAKPSKGGKHPFLNKLVGEAEIVKKKDADNAVVENLKKQFESFIPEEESAVLTPEDVVSAWNEVFPHSLALYREILGGATFKFKLAKDKSESANGIIDNDPLDYGANLDRDGKWSEYGTSLLVAPPEGSYHVYGSVKMRKKTIKNPTREQLVKRFKEVHAFVSANADKLHNIKFDIAEKLGAISEERYKNTNDVAGDAAIRMDPELLRFRNKARAHYPQYDRDHAMMKLLQRGQKHGEETDAQEDKLIAKLGKDIIAIRHRIEKLEMSSLKEGRIEAKGTKGLNATPWQKTFRSTEALNKWAEANDAEIVGTREADPDYTKAQKKAQREISEDVYYPPVDRSGEEKAAKKWTEEEMWQLSNNLADHMPDDYYIGGLSYYPNDNRYGAIIRAYEKDVRPRNIDINFDLDFGGGTPYPVDVQQDKLWGHSVYLGGFNDMEEFVQEGWEADLAKANRERMKKESEYKKLLAKQQARQNRPAKQTANYSEVMQDIQDALGNSFPDGDPIDYLLQGRKYKDSYGDLNMDLLDKAVRATKNGKSYNDYIAKQWRDHMVDFKANNPEQGDQYPDNAFAESDSHLNGLVKALDLGRGNITRQAEKLGSEGKIKSMMFILDQLRQSIVKGSPEEFVEKFKYFSNAAPKLIPIVLTQTGLLSWSNISKYLPLEAQLDESLSKPTPAERKANRELYDKIRSKNVVPSIDRERYTDIPGLEGPYRWKSGRVVYYDPQEGKYYDRDQDLYIDDSDVMESVEPELYTGYNEWKQAVSYATGGTAKYKKTDTQKIAIDTSQGVAMVMGVWDEMDGEGTVGLDYVFDDGVYVVQPDRELNELRGDNEYSANMALAGTKQLAPGFYLKTADKILPVRYGSSDEAFKAWSMLSEPQRKGIKVHTVKEARDPDAEYDDMRQRKADDAVKTSTKYYVYDGVQKKAVSDNFDTQEKAINARNKIQLNSPHLSIQTANMSLTEDSEVSEKDFKRLKADLNAAFKKVDTERKTKLKDQIRLMQLSIDARKKELNGIRPIVVKESKDRMVALKEKYLEMRKQIDEVKASKVITKKLNDIESRKIPGDAFSDERVSRLNKDFNDYVDSNPGTIYKKKEVVDEAPRKKSIASRLKFAYEEGDLMGVDEISKSSSGPNTFIFRRGFFYTSGGTAQKFAETVDGLLTQIGLNHIILDKGEVKKSFNGGASLRTSSHWWVLVRLLEDETVLDEAPVTAIPPTQHGNNPATDGNPLAQDEAMKNAMAATTTLKSATGSTAPAPNLAKAIDSASTGQAINAQDAKALEPVMNIVGAAAKDPNLANQFKTLANQAKVK